MAEAESVNYDQKFAGSKAFDLNPLDSPDKRTLQVPQVGSRADLTNVAVSLAQSNITKNNLAASNILQTPIIPAELARKIDGFIEKKFAESLKTIKRQQDISREVEMEFDVESLDNDAIPDPEEVDPRIRPTKPLQESSENNDIPIYEVTNLVKEMDHHIPKGAFARLVTYKEDLDKAKALASEASAARGLNASEDDFLKRSPMLMKQQGRRLTDAAVMRQAVREKTLSRMAPRDIALNLFKQRNVIARAAKKA